MATASQAQTLGWKDLYVAALLEGDKDKIPLLIDKAEMPNRRRKVVRTC